MNHVDGRTTDKAISAIPENITVMRAGITELVSASEEQTAVRELRSDIENSFAAFVNADPIKDFDAALKKFDEAFLKAKASSDVALTVIKGSTNVCEELQRRGQRSSSNLPLKRSSKLPLHFICSSCSFGQSPNKSFRLPTC